MYFFSVSKMLKCTWFCVIWRYYAQRRTECKSHPAQLQKSNLLMVLQFSFIPLHIHDHLHSCQTPCHSLLNMGNDISFRLDMIDS